MRTIGSQKNNFTASSVGDILPCIISSLRPCAIDFLKTCMYRPLLIFLICVLLPLANVPVSAERAPSYTPEEQKSLYEAQEAIRAKQFQKARDILLAHLREHPDKPHPLIYYALGNAWYMSGNLRKAYGAYEKGFALAPDSLPLCSNLGKVAYELGRFRKAGEMFEKAYALTKPRNTELLYHAGGAYYQAKAFRSAKSVLSRLIQSKTTQKKDRTEALRLLIQVCLESEDWKKAEAMLQDFLRQNPTDAEYWKLLSQIRMRRNDYRGTVSALEILYRIAPPSSQKWEELANLCFHMNAPLKAARYLEKAYGPHPGPAQCDKLSRAYAQAQRLDRAVRYLDLAMQGGRSAKRLLEKGKLFYERGRWGQAIRAFQECVRLSPDNAFAHLLLGYCALEKEDFALARKSFSAASKGGKYRRDALSALRALEDMETAD